MSKSITFQVRRMNPAPQGSKEYVGKNKKATKLCNKSDDLA